MRRLKKSYSLSIIGDMLYRVYILHILQNLFSRVFRVRVVIGFNNTVHSINFNKFILCPYISASSVSGTSRRESRFQFKLSNMSH